MRNSQFVISLFISCIFAFGSGTLYAADGNPDSLKVNPEREVARSQVMNMLDQLVHEWKDRYQQRAQHVPDSLNNDSNYRAVPVKPEVCKRRLDSILTPIPMDYNQVVHNFVELYAIKRRDQIRRMLSVKDYYFNYFEEELDKAGLPVTLKYMPVIESALNPTVRSHAGAVGIWQFMYSTARMYDLEINHYVDERRDPYKSTHAAIQYLKDMYAIYDDWLLAIASYNCGPGNVNKAIRRSGGHYDFWKVYRWLPRETRGYVPAFIAATYVFNYAEAYNLYPYNSSMHTTVDTVEVKQEVAFADLAEGLNVSEALLHHLNPQYRRKIIPGDRRPCLLRLPFKKAVVYAAVADSISSSSAQASTATDSEDTAPETGITKSASNKEAQRKNSSSSRKVTYIVRPGDNLGYIAEWFNVRASQIRNWNNIYGNLIHVGDRLAIYVSTSKVEQFTNINELSFAEKQNKYQARGGEPTGDGRVQFYYTVRRGDNLWRIAQGYPGVSVSDLKNWNKISSALYPGQKLVIYKES